jgi:hypothetical protein
MAVRARFLISGTLAGGTLLTLLGFVTAGMLPPRYKPFTDPRAVADAIRANAPTNDIYTSPDGLFVAVSLRPAGAPRSRFGPRLAAQIGVEFAVALLLAVLVLAFGRRSATIAAGLLALTGFAAGLEVHFAEWNFAGFPTAHFLAGVGYLSANWFITGFVLGALHRKLVVG